MPRFFDGRACLLNPNNAALTPNSPEAFEALRILIFYDGNDRRQVGRGVPAQVDKNVVRLCIRKFKVVLYKSENQTCIVIEAETDVDKNELVIIQRNDSKALFNSETLEGIDAVVTFCAPLLDKSNARQKLKIPYTGEKREAVNALVQGTSAGNQTMQNRRKSIERTTTTMHLQKTTTTEMRTVVEDQIEVNDRVPVAKKRLVGTLCYYYMHAGELTEDNKNFHQTIVQITDEKLNTNKSSRSDPAYLYDAISVGYGVLEKKIIKFTKDAHPKFYGYRFCNLEPCDLVLYTDDVSDDVSCNPVDCLRSMVIVSDEELLAKRVWTTLQKKNEDEDVTPDQQFQTPAKKKPKKNPNNDADEIRFIQETQQPIGILIDDEDEGDVNVEDNDDDDDDDNKSRKNNTLNRVAPTGNLNSTDLLAGVSCLEGVNSYNDNNILTIMNQLKKDITALTKDCKESKDVQSKLQNELRKQESEIDALKTENSAKEKELDALKAQMRVMREDNQVPTPGRGRTTSKSPVLSSAQKVELVKLVLNVIAEFGLVNTQQNNSGIVIDRQSAYFVEGDGDDDDMNITDHKVTSKFLFMVIASKFFRNVPNAGDKYEAIKNTYTETVGIHLTRAMFTTLVECSKFACVLWSSIRSNSVPAVPAAPLAPSAPEQRMKKSCSKVNM